MRLVRNILTTLAARLMVLLLGLVSAIVLARVLGPEGRGVFALVLILPGLAVTFGRLGVEEATTVYAGVMPAHRQALFWQSAAMALALGGILGILGMLYVSAGTPGLDGLVRAPHWMYFVPLATVPLVISAQYWLALLRGMNRILTMNVIEVLTKVTSVGVILVLVLWLGLGVPGAIWSNLTVEVGMVVALAWCLVRAGVVGRPTLSRALWKRTFGFALPAYGATLAAYLNYRIDEVMIARYLEPEALAFYVIAVGLAERIWILTGSVANALLPHLTNNADRDPMVVAEVARHVLLWTGLACAGVFAVSDVLLPILFSQNFAPAVAPLRWLLPGIFTLSVGKVVAAELLARQKPRLLLMTAVVGAVANIAANVVLIPRMGITGAAIGSSWSYTLMSCLLVGFYLRETGLPARVLIPRWSDHRPYLAVLIRFAKLRGSRRGER